MDAKPGETSDAAGAGKPDPCGRAAGVVTGLATQASREIGRWCSGIVRGPSISYMEGPRPILTDPRKLCRKRHAIGHRFGRDSRDVRLPRRVYAWRIGPPKCVMVDAFACRDGVHAARPDPPIGLTSAGVHAARLASPKCR